MEENISENSFLLSQYSPKVLAYMGDAVMELMVREYLIGDGNTTASKLNERAKEFVTANSQSAAAERIMPLLDENEAHVYKLGRNTKNQHAPKSASHAAYSRATGLECLFGYLFLSGRMQRARELFGYIRDNTSKP